MAANLSRKTLVMAKVNTGDYGTNAYGGTDGSPTAPAAFNEANGCQLVYGNGAGIWQQDTATTNYSPIKQSFTK